MQILGVLGALMAACAVGGGGSGSGVARANTKNLQVGLFFIFQEKIIGNC